MKKTLIALLPITLFFVACKKEVTELPAATQTGANTFGAKVNGELWVPQGFGPLPANDILEVSVLSGNAVHIYARNFSSSPNEKEFDIFLTSVTGPGTYQLNTTVGYPSSSANYGYYVKRNLTPQNEWITSATSTGTVVITRFDVVNRVISGTFQFNALNLYNSPEPLAVTEGRFDVKIP
jgi:Family of unknown function (DUF6252)